VSEPQRGVDEEHVSSSSYVMQGGPWMKNVLPEELHKSIPTYIRLTCQTFGMRRRIHVLLHVMRRRIHVLQDAYSSACLQRLTCHTFALGFGFEGLGFRL
jgi:hypothetical protein